MEEITISGQLNPASIQTDAPSYIFDLDGLSDYQALDLIAQGIIKVCEGDEAKLRRFFEAPALFALKVGVTATMMETELANRNPS